MISFTQILSKIDIFGVGVNLKINGNQTRDTALGGFISIVIVALSIAGIVWYGEDILYKEKPYSLYIEEVVDKPEFVDLTPEQFTFAIGLQSNDYKEFIDPEIYRVQAFLAKKRKFFNETSGQFEEEWSQQDLNMQPCQAKHFQNTTISSYFTQLAELNQQLCISMDDFQKSENFGIEGDFVNDFFSMIRIRFYQCVDDPSINLKCKNQTQIDAKLTDAGFAIYFMNNIIQLQNLEKPFVPFARDYFTPASNQMTKYNFMYFRTVYIETDVGWLMEDLRTIKGNIIAADIIDSIAHRNPQNKNSFFQELQIRCEKSRQGRYRRTYKKVQNLIAELGGLLKVLVMIGTVICVPVASIHLKQNLVNTLYTFDAPPEDLEIIQTKQEVQSSTGELENTLNMSEYQPNKFKDGAKAQYFLKDIIEKVFTTAKQVILISAVQSMLFYICPFGRIGRQQKILDHSYQKFSRHLDTFYIVKKLLEIDKLKMVIFNNEQRHLFQHLPQPLISCEDYDQKIRKMQEKRRQKQNQYAPKKDSFNTMYFDERSEYEKIKDAFSALTKFKNNLELTQFDKQIISLLHPEILEIFEEQHQNIKIIE